MNDKLDQAVGLASPDQPSSPKPKVTIVRLHGKAYLRIKPPWVKGYRPIVTYRQIQEQK